MCPLATDLIRKPTRTCPSPEYLAALCQSPSFVLIHLRTDQLVDLSDFASQVEQNSGNQYSIFVDVGFTLSQGWLGVCFRFNAAVTPLDHIAYVTDAAKRDSVEIRADLNSARSHDCIFGSMGGKGIPVSSGSSVGTAACAAIAACRDLHIHRAPAEIVEALRIADARDGRRHRPSLPLEQSVDAAPESSRIPRPVGSCYPLRPMLLYIIPKPTGRDKEVLEVTGLFALDE